jgi:hypothetical protein
MSDHDHGRNDDHRHDDDDDGFHHRKDLPPIYLDTSLDVTATDGNGHTLNGSGNPAGGWEVQNIGSFQLGADVHYRQGDIVQPAAVTDDGVLVYNMPAGAQVVDPAHGVSSANANRAAASFDFSFDTGVGPGAHQTIQDFLASGGEFSSRSISIPPRTTIR